MLMPMKVLLKKVADIAKENKIDCDFSWQPAYIYTAQDKYIKEIEDEIKAAQSLGIKADFVQTIDLPINIKGAMRFHDQAQFHPPQVSRAFSWTGN